MMSDDICLLFFSVIYFKDTRDNRNKSDYFDMGSIEMPTKTFILNSNAAFTAKTFVNV